MRLLHFHDSSVVLDIATLSLEDQSANIKIIISSIISETTLRPGERKVVIGLDCGIVGQKGAAC